MRIFPHDFDTTEGRRLTMLCSCKQGNLVIRKNQVTGQRFLACSRYPECKLTEPFRLENEGQQDLFGGERNE
jgi:ssDNA-binding Zn-finger/Zn-ribbon topoisomerase 1